MTLYEYIAVNNSSGANELLKNYGLRPTRSIDEIISRLKRIVRKYKKIALQDLTTIHPDKELLSSFTTNNISEKDFAYATGRTPGLQEPIEDGSGLNDEQASKVVEEIRDVKQQMLIDKLNRSKNELDKRIGNSQYGNSPVILLAIGFAVGYMIAKK
jgi:hypothetical protein|tara:strand:+ start:385 stop:855 length:471 start_codon:yes stop_codon:yes gene_type:complete|eukprot:COSAG01_NODE_6912_length_3443_cov_2.051136_6_plen_157_part_00